MPYADRADIENIYGARNVETWADLDNQAAAATITARINWALALAEEWVNTSLRCSRYVIPFGDKPATSVTITNLTAIKAGVLLYLGRGITDAQESQNHELSGWEKKADKIVAQLINGTLVLDVINDEADSSNDYPAVVQDI